MPASKFDVLVLGNYRQTLTVIRSLARAGHRVILGRSTPRVFTQYSRHVGEIWDHPDIDSSEPQFLRALAAFTRSRAAPLFVFPVGETELRALTCNAASLSRSAIPVMPDPEAVLNCLSKPMLYERAAALGLPVPEFGVVCSAAGLRSAAECLGFPSVVKPVDSSGDLRGEKAMILAGAADLVQRLPSWPAADVPLIVQRFAPGERRNCHFLADAGELLAYFEQRVLRTDRSDGTGYGVDGVSVPPTPALQGYTAKLAAALRYSGAGCAQFLVERKSGSAALLELNPRLDATCAIPYYCGYDFPAMAVGLTAHRHGLAPSRPSRHAPYPRRRGVWTSGDLERLGHDIAERRLRGREVPERLGKLLWSLARADFHLTFSWRDPLPAGYVLAGLLRTALRGTGRFLMRRWPFAGEGSR